MFWEWRWWRNGGGRAELYASTMPRDAFKPVIHYENPTYSAMHFPIRFYPERKDLPTVRREIEIFDWQPLTMCNLER